MRTDPKERGRGTRASLTGGNKIPIELTKLRNYIDTPTSGNRLITDGGVDQSDRKIDHSCREPENTAAAGQILRDALGEELPDGFLDDE